MSISSSNSNENANGAIDQNNSERILIKEPDEADVLCGRGRAIRYHPGNQTYLRLIQAQKTSYSTAVKGWKLEIVRGVVEAIREKKGRFLQKQNTNSSGSSHWVDIGDQKALNKTAQAFRDLKNTSDDNSNNSDNPQCGLTTDKNQKKKKLIKKTRKKPFGFLANHRSRLPSKSILHKKKKKESAASSVEASGSSSSSSEEEKDGSGSSDNTNSDNGSNSDESEEDDSDDEDKGLGADKSSQVSSSSGSESNDHEGDVSETETEDSFPMYRG